MDVRKWESSSEAFVPNVWFTDCKSLEEHLKNSTFTRCADKRLSIEMAALRQLIWLRGDGTLRDSLEEQEYQSDIVRWIDTSAMAADSLTKYMKSDRLETLVTTGILDLRPSDASIISKMAKQKQRARGADAKATPT